MEPACDTMASSQKRLTRGHDELATEPTLLLANAECWWRPLRGRVLLEAFAAKRHSLGGSRLLVLRKPPRSPRSLDYD